MKGRRKPQRARFPRATASQHGVSSRPGLVLGRLQGWLTHRGLSCHPLSSPQMGLGFMQFGFVAIYLSESFIRGFMTAAGLQILISVLKYIFGLTIPSYAGPGSIVFVSLGMSPADGQASSRCMSRGDTVEGSCEHSKMFWSKGWLSHCSERILWAFPPWKGELNTCPRGLPGILCGLFLQKKKCTFHWYPHCTAPIYLCLGSPSLSLIFIPPLV